MVLENKTFSNSKLGSDDLDSLNEAMIKARIDELMGLALHTDAESTQTMEKQGKVLSDLAKNVEKKPAFLRKRKGNQI